MLYLPWILSIQPTTPESAIATLTSMAANTVRRLDNFHKPMHRTDNTPADYLLGIPSAGHKATIFLVQSVLSFYHSLEMLTDCLKSFSTFFRSPCFLLWARCYIKRCSLGVILFVFVPSPETPSNWAILITESNISGWPDLSIGWRFQIPMLLEAGYRVVCPDIMGFGRPDAPHINQASDMAYYSIKRAADDIKELARQMGCETIILGGHECVSPVLSTPSPIRKCALRLQ